MSLFTAKEWQRYQRHVQLGKFGTSGQLALKQARVLIVGAGGLGCPAAQYLGAAGVGHINIVDADTVSRTNLQRQILFNEHDIGKAKAEIAKQRLLANNPHIDVLATCEHLTEANAYHLIHQADLVLDCTDNFTARYLINDTCLQTQTAWLYASVMQFSGQAALFTPKGACFRCLFPQMPQDVADCNSAGVLGVMPGLMATLQVNEAIKYLSGLDTPMSNTLMLVEGLHNSFTNIQLQQDPNCLCAKETISATQSTAPEHCASNTINKHDINPVDFEAQRQNTHIQLIDVRSVLEYQAFNIGGNNYPLSDDLAQQLDDKDKTYILFCQSGARSQQALTQLKNAGFSKLYNLQGGLAAWLEHHND